MSQYDYDDEPRRYTNVRTRPRERGEPDYVREETYIERGKGPGPRDLVYRGRDESIEDIPRDFPPPGGRDREYRRSNYREYDDTRSRRSKSQGRSRYDDDDDDDDRYSGYTAPTAAGAGAAAGYAAGRRKGGDRRRRKDRDYDSEYSDESRSPRRERKKSGFEDVLGGLGLGGVLGAITGKKDRDRSDSRSVRSGRTGRSRSRAGSRRRYSSDESSVSSGTKKKNTERKWAQAAQAALVAGAVEAFRSRKEAGPWTGEKGKRIATAAIGAGGIDGLLDRNPNEKSKRHLAEAVIGGLAANRLANGPRTKSRGREASYSPDGRARSRSRSKSIIDRFRGRSQSRGPGGSEGGGGGAGALKGLAAGGALAAAGTAIYNRVRSKSRKRRSPSRDSSADSYVPSRNRRRDRRGSPQSDTKSTRRSATGQDRDRGLGSQGGNGGGNDNNSGAMVARGAGGGAGAQAGGDKKGDGEKGDGDSESSSTSAIEAKRKHMRGKELLTAGLATVATIHAVHGVYSSMESHEKRHKMVAEGEMTPEEARKKQTKAWVQDAAAVGIAALGIKGAFSEWKEMNEHRYIYLIYSICHEMYKLTIVLSLLDARCMRWKRGNVSA